MTTDGFPHWARTLWESAKESLLYGTPSALRTDPGFRVYLRDSYQLYEGAVRIAERTNLPKPEFTPTMNYILKAPYPTDPDYPQTLAMILAYEGRIDLLGMLIIILRETSVLFESPDSVRSCLTEAIETNNLKVLEFLIFQAGSHREFLETPDTKGVYPIMKVINKIGQNKMKPKDYQILDCFCAHAPHGNYILELPNKDKITPIFRAVDYGNVELINYIVKKAPGNKACLNVKNKFGATLAHVAAQRGFVETLHLLRKISPKRLGIFSLGDDQGWTPAMTAAFFGQLEALRAIVEMVGPECLDHTDGSGITLAKIAAQSGHFSTLDYILETSPRGISQLYFSGKKAKFFQKDVTELLDSGYLEKKALNRELHTISESYDAVISKNSSKVNFLVPIVLSVIFEQSNLLLNQLN